MNIESVPHLHEVRHHFQEMGSDPNIPLAEERCSV
jgi:hypothetical protein